MKYQSNKVRPTLKGIKKNHLLILLSVFILFLASILLFFVYTPEPRLYPSTSDTTNINTNLLPDTVASITPARINPLRNKRFYIDNTTSAAVAARNYQNSGNVQNANLLAEVAAQPSAIWLTGPNDSDLGANRDIVEVARTSMQAFQDDTVPVYELYAIPNRDACAQYSNGGFDNSEQYMVWLDSILAQLKAPAVFSVEADAVSHTVNSRCMSDQEIDERYGLLNNAIKKLAASPNVLAVYLDAGHSEWFPDPAVMVEALKRSGVNSADGVVVNVSNFVPTSIVSDWSKELTELLGGELGVVIDTSRNGRGAPDESQTGEERWCNPGGRGLGNIPSTKTPFAHVDAFMWIKTPGESDGSCSGYPAAGEFVDELALELAINSIE